MLVGAMDCHVIGKDCIMVEACENCGKEMQSGDYANWIPWCQHCGYDPRDDS